MTITTNSLNQQAHYQQDYHHGRKVSLSENQAPPSNASETSRANNQPDNQSDNQPRLDTLAIEMLRTFSTSRSISEQQAYDPNQEDIYDRPLTGRVKMMKLILESTFGESIALVSTNMSNKIKPVDIQDIPQDSSPANNEFPGVQIRLGQNSFMAGDRLTVEEWQIHQQELSYKMQGEFDINGKQLSLDYSFTLAREKIKYTSFETTAAALKDPLIVQFGEQSLGEISGQESFDINQDHKMDNLPVFLGDVGYLVYDKNANNKADNGSELFGPTSGNGFNELAQLDENNNGFLDKEDSAYQKLYLWQPDKNTWLSLADAGIEAINTDAIATPYTFYDKDDVVQAQLRNSSFAVSESGRGLGVHQVDVRI
ncbi:MAG: hypothetical protein ACI9LM_001487 [Alteromonadaceae bacterium]|jgi:hypothetical protein